jgi:hypothetical protein
LAHAAEGVLHCSRPDRVTFGSNDAGAIATGNDAGAIATGKDLEEEYWVGAFDGAL